MRYVVYDETTGKIFKVGQCDRSLLAAQAEAGQTARRLDPDADPAGPISDATHKVVAGEIVAKTPTEIEADRPPVLPLEDRQAYIARRVWLTTLLRLNNLENRLQALEEAQP